jgi:glycosyltransferase involved in cell wall biosynthesis
VRDAIVISGWIWEAFNVPERLALALTYAGSRVLYCESPASIFRRSGEYLKEVEPGIFAFRPTILGHRLNAVALASRLQFGLVANQILQRAEDLKLRNPLFVYPHSSYALKLSKAFKRRGFPLVHVCMDYEPAENIENARISDVSLAIPRAAFEELRAKFGEKVKLIPQFGSTNGAEALETDDGEPPELANIPRPRLGYIGNVHGRTSAPLVRELLSKHPEWHFFSFGAKKTLNLPNEHVLAWRPRMELPEFVKAVDVGFMPYDCSSAYNLNCVPLKLFDYFAAGIPVVSTPIACMSEYADLVYTGRTADELAEAVSRALSEGADSTKKARRMAVAREHSIVNLSLGLKAMLMEGTTLISDTRPTSVGNA